MDLGIAGRYSSIVLLILSALFSVCMLCAVLFDSGWPVLVLLLFVPAAILALAILNAVEKKMDRMSLVALAVAAVVMIGLIFIIIMIFAVD